MATAKNRGRRSSAARTRSRHRLRGADYWQLRLYIAGRSPKSITAFRNLERLCQTHLADRYSIEVVDLLEQPRLAAEDQIVAVPTLVRRLPPPLRKIVGDLENEERTLVGLQLRPARPAGA